MSKLYTILAIIGWVWTVIVALYLIVKLSPKKEKAKQRGLERRFEVIAEHHEEQR